VSTFDIGLLVAGCLLAYVLVAAIVLRLIRFFDGDDIFAFIWPLCIPVGVPVLLLCWFGMGVYRLCDKVVLASERKWGKPQEPSPPPEITVPDGAAMTTESYRRLKPMIQQFESAMPMMERE